MSRQPRERGVSGEQRQYALQYGQIVRALSASLPSGRFSELRSDGRPRNTVSKPELTAVRQAVVAGDIDVIGTLEARGMLGMSEEGRQHIISAFSGPEFSPLARLCNFNPETGSLAELHRMYKRITPRLMAFDATRNGYVREPKTYRQAAEEFLLATVLPALPEDQRDLYQQAIDIERDLQGSTVGIAKVINTEDLVEQRIAIRERRKGTLAVMANGINVKDLSTYIGYVLQFDPSTAQDMAGVLSAIAYNLEQNAEAEPVREMQIVLPPGYEGGNFGEFIQAAIQQALGGNLPGEQVSTLELGALHVGNGELSADGEIYHSVVGGLIGNVYGNGFVGKHPEEELQEANPFQSEAEIQTTEETLGANVDVHPGVRTFSYTAGADTQLIMLSSGMTEGISRAMSQRVQQIADRAIMISMQTPERFLEGIMEIEGLTAQERMDLIREVALIGLRQEAHTMAGVMLQIPDYKMA